MDLIRALSPHSLSGLITIIGLIKHPATDNVPEWALVTGWELRLLGCGDES